MKALSVFKRIVCPGKPPNPRLMKAFRKFVRRWCKKNLHQTPLLDAWAFEKWLADGTYTEERKAELRLVRKKVEMALTAGDVPTDDPLYELQCFIKGECYDEIKMARWICSRSDEYKVLVGPLIHEIEAQVYAVQSPAGHPYFVKYGDNSHKLAILQQMVGTCYSSDFVSFESFFTHDLCYATEAQLFIAVTEGYYRDLVMDVVFGMNRLSSHEVKVTCPGRRMSGELWTSLGNGFTNLMVHLFLNRKHSPDAIVEGDDACVCLCTNTLPTEQQFADLGFNVKITPELSPATSCFCKICGPDGQLIRDPCRFLRRFAWTMAAKGHCYALKDSLLLAKCLSVLADCPHCPIIAPLANAIRIRLKGLKPRYDPRDMRWMHTIPDEDALQTYQPTQATRLWFASMYSISLAEQLEFEGDPLSHLSTLANCLARRTFGTEQDVLYSGAYLVDLPSTNRVTSVRTH